MRTWSNLLNSKRFRDTDQDHNDKRDQFERDYDRITYCSSFRRLQDKTQVFPLERGDYVRTRLTHSLEVSSLARSIGTDVARHLIEKNMITETREDNINKIDDYFAGILSSAALIHDLGNPPFGHFGEDAIKNFFDDYFKEHKKVLCTEKDKAKREDFLHFDGNPQSFRIVTSLQYLKDKFGLNLTYATLGTVLKYPCSSVEINKENKCQKKCGYFQSEKETFGRMEQELHLDTFRHPLTFLLEAADDIAYFAGDIEDGLKQKTFTWEQFQGFLENKAKKNKMMDDCFKLSSKNYEKLKNDKFPEPEIGTIQLFRIKAQSMMLRACINEFLSHYKEILEGKYNKDLLESSDASEFSKLLKKLSVEHVYSSDKVLLTEIAGKKVIEGLLSAFVSCVMSESYMDSSTYEGKLFQIISPNFRYVFSNWTDQGEYAKLQLVTDFISGMTDLYAVDLFQKITGVTI